VSTSNTDLGPLLTAARDSHRKGDLAEAEKLYCSYIERSSDNVEVLTLLGTLYAQRGNFEDAIRRLEQSLSIEHRQPFALNSLGNVLNSLGRYEDALQAFNRALALKQNHSTALNNRGTSLRALRRSQEALASIDKAIVANPEYPEAFNNRGLALHDLGRRLDALRSYDRAIMLRPEFPDALKNRGNVLRGLKRFDEALKSYNQAIALVPDAGAYHGRSFALMELKRFDEALADIRKAVELDPHLPFALGQLLLIKTQLCDWEGMEETRQRVVSAIRSGARACAPFSILSVDCTPDIRRRCAEIYVADRYPRRSLPDLKAKPRGETSGRIRVAYLSADLHSHAVATLASGLFEQHDRTRFEVHAISFGQPDESPMRRRLEKAFEHFTDVSARSDLEVAELLRQRNIDIAVDLMGFTAGCRTGILSYRPAPVQVSYLGFPGTMGTNYIDYIIADSVVIPDEDRPFYSECVVHLPDSYQCNAPQRPSLGTPGRTDAGLPSAGFVFCCFNACNKITPAIFDVWMRILQQTDGSVLWLIESNIAAKANLRREAEKRGIGPDRLVFAPVVGHADHLARHALADLFLDTLPYGAHTTASDALWTGLPVLTCLGDGFAGRVAASLLGAVGLSEIVTHSLAEYEQRATALAKDPAKVEQLKAKLISNRATHALFNTARFTRNLEAAYTRMMETHRRGQPPAAFAVSASGAAAA
jgi:predicted O-linked N-acetylglucosamine transferase (SPINDLY family)